MYQNHNTLCAHVLVACFIHLWVRLQNSLFLLWLVAGVSLGRPIASQDSDIIQLNPNDQRRETLLVGLRGKDLKGGNG